MKLIIGANGRTGRLIAAKLIQAGERPRLMVRDTETALRRFGETADIRQGDLDDVQAIDRAVDGCDAVFLCSPVTPDQVRQHNAVIDAAAARKAYVVKLSGLATFPDSYVDSGRWHAETETYLAGSGTTYTCLHPYFFMQNMDFQLKGIREKGILRSALANAAISMVDARDIAAVAATLLMDRSIAPRETLPLTCDTALTYPEMAEVMGEVFGRPVSFELQNIAEVEWNLRKAGQPDWHIKIILQFNRAFEAGLGASPHPAVRDILKRDPISFEQYLRTAEVNDADSNPFPS